LSMHDAAGPAAPGGATPKTGLPGRRLRQFPALEAVILRSLAASDRPPALGA